MYTRFSAVTTHDVVEDRICEAQRLSSKTTELNSRNGFRRAIIPLWTGLLALAVRCPSCFNRIHGPGYCGLGSVTRTMHMRPRRRGLATAAILPAFFTHGTWSRVARTMDINSSDTAQPSDARRQAPGELLSFIRYRPLYLSQVGP